MRKEATLKQWKELYDIAIKVKELKPWLKLGELDFITIKDKENIILCRVLGDETGECSIRMYEGEEAIDNLFIMLENPNIPEEQRYRYEKALICKFGSREDLTVKDRRIISDLGYKFRGKNNWVYFRSFEPPYMPYFLSENQVLRLTEIFQQLYGAIEAINNGIEVDFSKGKTLLRSYDKELKVWLNSEKDIIRPEVKYPSVDLKDEILLRRLQKKECNWRSMDMDIALVKSQYKNKICDRPYYGSMIMMIDIAKLDIVIFDGFTPEVTEEEKVKTLYSKFIEYILLEGRPAEINVRDKKMKKIFEGFCNKLDIKIDVAKSLECTDEFVELFTKFKF